MVEIRDREDLERWLDDKPAEVARVMALRAALRVLPLANARGEGFDLTPAVLRSLFISWARFKAERLADQADWVIWIQWYERRLSGDRLGWDIDPDQHEALCVGLALESNTFWDRPATEVNAEISARVEAARLPPQQDASVAQFELDTDKRITRAPLPDDDRLSDSAPQRDHYLEFRKSFDALASLTHNEVGDTLRTQIDDLHEVLTVDIEDLNRHLFWPRFARLRKTLAKHDRATASQDYSANRLEGDTADDLREVVNNGHILIADQPKLLLAEQQATHPLPSQDPPPTEISSLVDATAKDGEVTEPDAGKDAMIANEAAIDAPADLPAARNGTRVLGNFVTMLVERSRQLAKKIGDAVVSEGTKISLRLLWDNRDAIGNFLTSLAPEVGKWAIRELANLARYL
ncbi:MAG: hypothetical protein JF615_07665 [Asticcacaulis sp.]|nr:hypothetical protein [Asticcacaulis sp.]